MPEKILLVSYSFPPSNAPAAQRAFYFAKYLPQNEIEATVLTTSKNISSLGYGNSMNTEGMSVIDTSGNFLKNNFQPKNKITSKDVVKKNWVKKILVQFLIPDRGIIWLPQALKFGAKFLKENKEVKTIFATAPSFTNLLIALILAKRFQKKLICDFRDCYYTNISHKRIFPLSFIDKWIEKKIIKQSARVIFISKRMKKIYSETHPNFVHKFSLIYNGFDEVDFENVKAENASDDRLIIFFAGSLYYDTAHERNILQLLEVLNAAVKKGLIDSQKIEIRIAAHIPAPLLALIHQHELVQRIKLLGMISREKVLHEMMQANLLWHILGKSNESYSAIPIKTFEYIAAQKPVLFFIPKNCELEEIAVENNLGYTCFLGNEFADENLKTVVNAFEEIVNQKKKFATDLHQLKKFKREFQATQLAEIIKQLK